jgi:hypothetical protein
MPLAAGAYYLSVWEPFPVLQLDKDIREESCAFWDLGFEVSFAALPSGGALPHSAAAGLQHPHEASFAAEQNALSAAEPLNLDALCPYEPLPATLNTVGLAGLHGSHTHLSGTFRVDLTGGGVAGGKHEMSFATQFLHASPFTQEGAEWKTSQPKSEPTLFRLYVPAHETNLPLHIELLRVIRSEDALEFSTVHSIDATAVDHMVAELPPGEYVLRFALGTLSFHPQESLCETLVMELSLLPVSRARIAADCTARDPAKHVPECPAIPFHLAPPDHIGMVSPPPFAAELDLTEWQGGSAILSEFPLEIRYRDTVLDIEAWSDFARAPVLLVLKTHLSGAAEDRELIVDAELPAGKPGAENNENAYRADAETLERFTGSVLMGRQLQANSNSIRTILKPGHYSIQIRLLAPAEFSTLQTGREHGLGNAHSASAAAEEHDPIKAMKERHHVCVPFDLRMSLETALPHTIQQQACLEHSGLRVPPLILSFVAVYRDGNGPNGPKDAYIRALSNPSRPRETRGCWGRDRSARRHLRRGHRRDLFLA